MEVMLGLRVVRGPDWMWGDQDGGEGHVGTVVSVHDPRNTGTAVWKMAGPCVCTVQWDTGARCRYRCGVGDKYDLRILDSSPAAVHIGEVRCGYCQQFISGMRWKCSDCGHMDMCMSCYMLGQHSRDHTLIRVDTDTVKVHVGSQSSGRSVETRGCYLGATVIPGHDWAGPQLQDIAGKVIAIQGCPENTYSRSHVEVEWMETETKSTHTMGWEGKVELKCTESTSAGTYCPEQLPSLGALPLPQQVAEEEEQSELDENSPFKVGDFVRVELEQDILKELQENGPGSNPYMLMNIINVTGLVVAVKSNGHLRVHYKTGMTWTLCPEAVVKVDVPQWQLGQLLKVVWHQFVEEVFQRAGVGHTYTQIFRNATVRVVDVSPHCTVQVIAQGLEMPFHPAYLEPYEEPRGLPWPHPLDVDGGVAALKAYLKLHPEQVNQRRSGRTELHVAASNGDVEVMKTLLEFKADADIVDADDCKALHYAVMSGNSDAVQLVLQSGADVDSAGPNLRTPLIMAVEKDLSDITDLLLHQPGIYVNGQDSSGHTALHIAVMNNNLEIVKLLLEHGADPRLNDFRYLSPIIDASKHDFVEIVKVMVGLDSSLVNYADDTGTCLLCTAAFVNSVNVVNFLLSQENCEIDYMNHQGYTPLLYAIYYGNTVVAEMLIEHGADVNICNTDDSSPLLVLVVRNTCMEIPTHHSPNMMKMCSVLLGDTVPDNVLSAYTVIIFAGYLLRKGADMHKANKEGLTPLKQLPYLSSLFSLLTEHEHLFSDDGPSLPGGLLQMYGGLKLSFSTKGHNCAHCHRYHYHECSHASKGTSSQDGGQYGTTEDYYDDDYAGDVSWGYQSASEGSGRSRTSSSSRQPKTMIMFFTNTQAGSGRGTDSSEAYVMNSGSLYANEFTSQSATDKLPTTTVSETTPTNSSFRAKLLLQQAYNSQSPGKGPASASVSSSLPPPSIEELKEEECYLCESPAGVRFSPCGHTAMCSACAPRAKKCPICRKPVEGFSEL